MKATSSFELSVAISNCSYERGETGLTNFTSPISSKRPTNMPLSAQGDGALIESEVEDLENLTQEHQIQC